MQKPRQKPEVKEETLLDISDETWDYLQETGWDSGDDVKISDLNEWLED